MKTGDAKPWVYLRASGNDCQAAEDHKSNVVMIPPGFPKPGFFIGWPTPPMQPRTRAGVRKKEKAMFRNLKVLLIALFVIALAGSAYGFAAANTVPDSAAGSGASTVSGYTVSNIAYDLDFADPTTVDAITFSLSPDSGSEKAASVLVQTDPAGTWTTCTLADGTLPAVDATCTFGALALEDVTVLNIVASSTTDPNP